jgi:hypothetical protein
VDVARLLDQLCVELGFCLDGESRASLIQDPPVGVDEFTDAVIRAEGLDPLTLERALRKQVRDRVARAVQVS